METPLKKIISCHQEIANTIKQRLRAGISVPQAEWNRWVVAHAIFARSSNYAQAASLLLEKAYWEATYPLTRTVFEDAAVLGYIHSREKQAEDFAKLYVQSDWLDRYRGWQRSKKHGMVPPAGADLTPDDLQQQMNEFCVLRATLWQGKRDENDDEPCFENPSMWNGLSIESTFRQACLAMQYDECYSPLCTLVHSSAFALSFGFQGEMWQLDESIDRAREASQVVWIKRQLKLALGMQVTYAKQLTGVTPKNGVPDLETLGQEARETIDIRTT